MNFFITSLLPKIFKDSIYANLLLAFGLSIASETHFTIRNKKK